MKTKLILEKARIIELFQYNSSGVTTELPQAKPTPATLDSIVEKWFCSPKPDSTREAMKQACLEYAATVQRVTENTEIARLTAKNQELMKDKVMLDWLLNLVNTNGTNGLKCMKWDWDEEAGCGLLNRSAITAAMQKGKE